MTQAFECLHHLCDIRDNGLFAVGHLRQEVFEQRLIHGKFHFLRVDHDQFQFGGVLLVEQRSDDGVEADRLTLSRCTGHEEVGHFGQVDHKALVRDGFAQSNGELVVRLLEFLRVEDALHRHNLRLLVGHFNTDGVLAGNGGDDANAQGRKAERDVVLQVLNL